MKKKTKSTPSRPLILAFVILLGLPAFQALTPCFASAGTDDGDPFAVSGTDRTLLTPEQLHSLQQSADTSRARLQRLLDESDGLTADGKNEKFRNEITDVIKSSFTDYKGSETLMRTVLVQAMDLTYGIPNANGVGVRSHGVLDTPAGNAYPGIKMAIMESSVKLALKFYMNDRAAIDSGALGNLPYNRLARDRMVEAYDHWLSMLNFMDDQWEVKFDLSQALLYQWIGTVKDEANQSEQQSAEEVTQVQLLLDKLPKPGVHPADEAVLEQDVRKMNKRIDWLVTRLKARQKSEN